jgi:hypothetical protein
MNWEAIGAIGEVLGALGVIITLAYLAIQIRQNTRSQRVDSYARSLDRVTSLQARMSDNPKLGAILLKGVLDSNALSRQERVQFTWAFYEMFSGFEFIFHQAESGTLPKDVWNRWAETLFWWLSFPGVRAWWDSRPTPFTPDFTDFIERRLATSAERPLRDDAAQERWVQFLLGSS